MPGRNGTRSAISAATVRIASARSAMVCDEGSPVEPPIEMPCEPEASCQWTSRRSESWSTAPSAVNGVTSGAIDPVIEAGSERNDTWISSGAGGVR